MLRAGAPASTFPPKNAYPCGQQEIWFRARFLKKKWTRRVSSNSRSTKARLCLIPHVTSCCQTCRVRQGTRPPLLQRGGGNEGECTLSSAVPCLTTIPACPRVDGGRRRLVRGGDERASFSSSSERHQRSLSSDFRVSKRNMYVGRI
jgi:hypothetical protein